MRRTSVVLVAALLAASGSYAVAAPTVAGAAVGEHANKPKPPTCQTSPNPWLDQRVMNMAHSGGEHEAPMNTLYAFERARDLGADMLELDVQSTKDNELVVIHDSTVDDTTDGTGYVKDMWLKKLQRLDAAYWFIPGRSTVHGEPDAAYPLRGARFGDPKVPGHQRKDFRIPTLEEVFKRFRNTPINIEIKGTNDADVASYMHNAELLAAFLNTQRRCDVIVGSFNDAALAHFHSLAPQIPMSAGRDAMIGYFLAGTPLPAGTVALQIPVSFNGIPVATPEFVARAHRDGYAVHVWFSGSAPDDAPTYNAMIDTCADGIMPAKPTLLESILDERGIERPGTPGVHPCAS